MEISDLDLFNVPSMIVTEGTEVYRFNCTLIVSTNGVEGERVGKRKFFVDELRGQGYIGFDAYNHCVDKSITDRIRINYIGKDFICLFVRTPAQGGVPTMHKVSFENNGLRISKDCGNGVVYTLITTIKRKGE